MALAPEGATVCIPQVASVLLGYVGVPPCFPATALLLLLHFLDLRGGSVGMCRSHRRSDQVVAPSTLSLLPSTPHELITLVTPLNYIIPSPATCRLTKPNHRATHQISSPVTSKLIITLQHFILIILISTTQTKPNTKLLTPPSHLRTNPLPHSPHHLATPHHMIEPISAPLRNDDTTVHRRK